MRRVALGDAEVVLSGKREISARRLFAAIQQLEQAKACLEVTEECPFVFIILTDTAGSSSFCHLSNIIDQARCASTTHPNIQQQIYLHWTVSKTAITLLDV